jgi:hypothetical protein
MTAPKRLGDVDRQASNEFEGEIREFIRRDVSTRRPSTSTEPIATSQAESENLNSLLERVSGATVAEIDRLIAELQTIRSLLQSEGERVRREITGYAGLSQSAVATMKVINDTLTQLRPSALPSSARSD